MFGVDRCLGCQITSLLALLVCIAFLHVLYFVATGGFTSNKDKIQVTKDNIQVHNDATSPWPWDKGPRPDIQHPHETQAHTSPHVEYFTASGGFKLNKEEIQVHTRATRPHQEHEGTCPDVQRPLKYSKRAWQVQNTDDEKLVVHSAFREKRPGKLVVAWLRVHGVAKLAPRTHYCYVWYRERGDPYVTDVVVSRIGPPQGYVLEGTAYVQYLFSCRLPGTDLVPSHVSIVADRCTNSTIYLPIRGRH